MDISFHIHDNQHQSPRRCSGAVELVARYNVTTSLRAWAGAGAGDGGRCCPNDICCQAGSCPAPAAATSAHSTLSPHTAQVHLYCHTCEPSGWGVQHTKLFVDPLPTDCRLQRQTQSRRNQDHYLTITRTAPRNHTMDVDTNNVEEKNSDEKSNLLGGLQLTYTEYYCMLYV